MNVKGLLLRELTEGMTETELALTIGVQKETLNGILADKEIQDPADWEKLAKYFRMGVEVLRTGGSTHSITRLSLSARVRPNTDVVHKIPLLDWPQLEQMFANSQIPDVIHSEALLDAIEVFGRRTFGLKVKDDSMETMFSEGEIIFVDPDSEWAPEDYVIVNHVNGNTHSILLRQIQAIANHYMLHALNPKYKDYPLREEDRIWGKVIRLTKPV